MKLKTPHDGVPLLIDIRMPRTLYLDFPQMDGPMLTERASTRPMSYLLHHSTDQLSHILLALSICSVFFVVRCWRTQASLPLPPGPRPLPIVGNMFDIPKTMSAYEYATLSQKYGTTFSRLFNPCQRLTTPQNRRCRIPERTRKVSTRFKLYGSRAGPSR